MNDNCHLKARICWEGHIYSLLFSCCRLSGPAAMSLASETVSSMYHWVSVSELDATLNEHSPESKAK